MIICIGATTATCTYYNYNVNGDNIILSLSVTQGLCNIVFRFITAQLLIGITVI